MVPEIVNGGVNGAGANTGHVAPFHPLLRGRHEAANAAAAAVSRYRSLQRHRAFRGYIHLGTRGGGPGHPSAPAIIQNFLGTNPQDLINHGLRRGAPLLIDVGYAMLDSYENDLVELENLTRCRCHEIFFSSPFPPWEKLLCVLRRAFSDNQV
jgi:hypothetical protein